MEDSPCREPLGIPSPLRPFPLGRSPVMTVGFTWQAGLGDAMAEAGLCAGCRHAHVIEGRESTFYRCKRHEDEPQRFPRFPELPVRECEGHEEGIPERSSGD